MNHFNNTRPPKREIPVARRLSFILLIVGFVWHGQGRAQSFSYPPVLCTNGFTVAPILPPGFPSGGIFTSSPLGVVFWDASSGIIDLSSSTAGFYVISYDTNPSCLACPYTATIQVNSPPSVSVDNTTMCTGPGINSLVLTANPPSGLTYTWEPFGGNQSTYTLFFPSSQQFTLYVTNTEGCTGQFDGQITVFNGPSINISGNNAVCAGSSILLNTFGAFTYTWSTGSTANAISVTPLTTTVYSIITTDENGCSATDTKTITVVPKPALTVNSQTLCSQSIATLVAKTIPPNGSTFFWQPGNVLGPNFTVSPVSSMVYSVTVTQGGCTNVATSTVTVVPSLTAPVSAFFYNIPVCVNAADQLPVTMPSFFYSGIFYSNDSIRVDSATGKISLAGIKAGSYQVNYTLAAKGCTSAATGSAVVLVNDVANLSISPSLSISPGESVPLSVSGGEFYRWDEMPGLSCYDCDKPIASPMESTRYCVGSVVNGCYSQGCINVEVVCENTGDLSVPNAFTPNGDGRNERFCLQGWKVCNTSFNVRIFDRWGEMVYESENPSFCWDGIYQGQLLSSGVFVYVITATFNNGPQVKKKGNITLIR